MEYYGAIGDDRAILIQRYFMSDDPEVKAKALGEILEIMGKLVCYLLTCFILIRYGGLR